MSQIFEGLDGVECNIDDILVYGRTQTEHDRRLEAVLRRLGNVNVTLNAEKCVFKFRSVKFLGQIVGSNQTPKRSKQFLICHIQPTFTKFVHS